MVGRGAPRVLQELHPAELLERGATPVGRGTPRLQPALALCAVLVAQHPKFSGAIPAQSVRTKQPKPLVIDGFCRLFARYSRPDPADKYSQQSGLLPGQHSSLTLEHLEMQPVEEFIFI